ncbi:D-alanyl-D-alanine carboxypeptidase family protein [Roseisalinus antarcticus]|uniref:serine-type D-Ala-D-Ala carboxypeptidase n=1 Tax=Roseisalinus antarcticus TaxID=254357 RepID=A0A1Y5TQ32_9RHOB|nr:D-alanyl-D-alanine carboxypeptidase family protein [Roseisalinus antarcticus]SLN67113.1 D-alanyl-D-alanine carboxypeptidase DacC precursor [Roseisalinus antarcticus]
MVRRLAALLLVFMAAAPPLSAQTFDTQAGAAYVLDQTTGTVLLEKQADAPLPPASMSKLMTLYMAFEAIADGRLQLDERLPVSEHAMSYGGSTMFLDTTDRPLVEDLLRGIIVLSGNDACAVIAEALSPDGTEAGFARLMTERGREIGLTNSVFVNSNGWPAPGHHMSMRDLGTLANRLITEFPTFYPLFSEQEFLFDGRAPTNIHNRNPLLGLGIGADGLKTGHTQEAGYGLVGSAKQGDRRIIFVISGLDTQQQRADESERLVNWAFRQFVERKVTTAGTRIAEAEVWMGAAPDVGLTVTEDVRLLLPVLEQDSLSAEVIYTGPIEAPVAQGDEVAELVINREGLPEVRVPLVAEADVERGGFRQRVQAAALVVLRKIAPEADLTALPGA